MRVAVVDDEPLARLGVLTRLRVHSDLSLYGEFADATAAFAAFSADPPDLAFVDVQMPGKNGLELLTALPMEKRPLAILLTAHDRFAVEAFALNALDYLLKPIDEQRFAEALERARRQMALRPVTSVVRATSYVERFSVRVGNRDILVAVREIEWISADGDYATLHLQGRELPLRESLLRLESQLDPNVFARVHRSAIVRIDRICELQTLPNRDALIRLQDGTPVRVSRTYIDNLLERLRLANRC